MFFPVFLQLIYTTAAKSAKKYQKSTMVKLCYTAKSFKLRGFVVYNNSIM